MSQTSNASQYPFQNVEGNLFTPVCLKTHWDPTEMLRHILPQQKVGLPQDFRPWVKVCKNYVTSAPMIEAPLPPTNMVFPTGGEFYPPGRYSNNIDKESVLRTLDHPLDKWCPSTKYIPKEYGDLYVPGSTVPERKAISAAFVSELSMPQATKQDRYGANKYYALPTGSDRGEPMPHGGVNEVQPTRQAIISQWPIEQPGGALPVTYRSEQRPIKGFGSTTFPGTNGTSFVGVATSGSAARVW